MCTVTYLPRGSQSFVLTSNRDEAPGRAGHELITQTRPEATLLFPQDPTAGGTWIATSDRQRTLVILNGAFAPHRRQPPYRRSRGLMVLDYFDFPDNRSFLAQYRFEGMEPFTLIMIEPNLLMEIRWDGRILHRLPHDPARPHLWASATLYSRQAIDNRWTWFADWQATPSDDTPQSIWHWHHTAGNGDPYNDVVMNRHDLVRTVSVTQIESTPSGGRVRFEDLLSGREYVGDLVL